MTLHPGPLVTLVGEATAGKSNLLAAARALLDPTVAPVAADVTHGLHRLRLEAELAGGDALALKALEAGGSGDQAALAVSREGSGPAPPVLFLPSELRAGPMVAAGAGDPVPAGHDAGRCRGTRATPRRTRPAPPATTDPVDR
jgi:hypothetical protein